MLVKELYNERQRRGQCYQMAEQTPAKKRNVFCELCIVEYADECVLH